MSIPRTRAKIGVVPTEILLSYDGLSFLKALIAGELPAPPITETLGFTLTEAEPGRAVFRGTPEYRHYNDRGLRAFKPTFPRVSAPRTSTW